MEKLRVRPQPPSHWTVFRTPLVPPLWPLLRKTAVTSNSLFIDVTIRNSFFSLTHPWKRCCSLGGVESPGRQPCHEHMVAFCQSWESMFSFCSYFLQSLFLFNTCSTSHFAVGCFSRSNTGEEWEGVLHIGQIDLTIFDPNQSGRWRWRQRCTMSWGPSQRGQPERLAVPFLVVTFASGYAFMSCL